MNDETHLPSPRTWLILGERAGDNAQVLALGSALGWPTEIKQIRYDETCPVDFKDRGETLTGVDLEASAPLSPPWPDAIIAIGRRSVPVTRWIRAQAGKRVLHIHLGRPRVDLDLFDLVVTTPQYNLPDAPNVIEITLPLVSVDPDDLGRAAAIWHSRFAALPRPWTAVMVGGPTPQLAFESQDAQRMVRELSAQAPTGGSLLVTTSPRTPIAVTEALRAGLERAFPGRHLFVPFERGGENPYPAMLALADDFVISADSASMVAEAATRQKPLYLFHLPKIPSKIKPGLKAAVSRNWRLRRKARQDAGQAADPLDKLYDFWTRRGKARPRRDIDQMERRLLDLGVALPLGTPSSATADQLSRAVTTLRAERRAVLDRAASLWRDFATNK